MPARLFFKKKKKKKLFPAHSSFTFAERMLKISLNKKELISEGRKRNISNAHQIILACMVNLVNSITNNGYWIIIVIRTGC